MDIDERFTKLHGILELVETRREVIEYCHGDADETFTHPITDYLLSRQEEIERLKGECHTLEHYRRYLAINFLEQIEDGINPVLYTQVVNDCKEWKDYRPLANAQKDQK